MNEEYVTTDADIAAVISLITGEEPTLRLVEHMVRFVFPDSPEVRTAALSFDANCQVNVKEFVEVSARYWRFVKAIRTSARGFAR